MDLISDEILLNRFIVEERPLRRLANKCTAVCRASPEDTDALDPAALALEFSQYQNSLRRLSLTNTAHARESQRYIEMETQVLEQQAEARAKVAELERGLADAERALADENAYDALARDIQSQFPRERESQETAIATLEEEIAELVRERDATKDVWQVRQRAFEEIFGALKRMATDIRGEKEDAERKAGMADSDEDEDGLIKEAPPTTTTTPTQPMEIVEVDMAEAGEVAE